MASSDRHSIGILLVIIIGVLVETGRLVNGDDTKTKPAAEKKGYKTHGLTHCELKPYLCTAICGNSNPSCELAGNCMCAKPPHKHGPNCTQPIAGLEAKRCHPGICKHKIINTPLICHHKKSKICACFPSQVL